MTATRFPRPHSMMLPGQRHPTQPVRPPTFSRPEATVVVSVEQFRSLPRSCSCRPRLAASDCSHARSPPSGAAKYLSTTVAFSSQRPPWQPACRPYRMPLCVKVPGLGASVVGWWPGPGVAWPKSRLLGCDPAALAAQSFPYCPPGSLTWAWARWASARSREKTASLTCRLSARRASLRVLPSASFLSK